MQNEEAKGCIMVCGYKKKTLIIVLVLLVIAVGAFFAGAKYEKSKLAKLGLLKGNASCITSEYVTGEVTAKTDADVTIKTGDGNVQNISLASLKPGKKNVAALTNLTIGQKVTFEGVKNADGSFSAQNIKQTAAAVQSK